MDEFEEFCIAGGKIHKEDLIPPAWDASVRDKHDDKSLYILRLVGLHLLKFSEEDKDKLIKTLKEILNIKEFINVSSSPTCQSD